MITPQEAESHVFSKASFGGGYNMAQVDAFLDVLIADYTALYKENAALKGKMKVLVDKIEEYRSTEDAMRMTLLSAQKMADTLLKEAEGKKEEALQRYEAEAATRMEQIQREIANEELRLTAARNSTAAYVARLKELYTHELEYIGQLSEMTAGQTAAAADSAAPLEDTISKLMKAEPEEAEPEAQAEAGAEPASEEPESAPEEAEKAAPEEIEDETVVFDRLQFGKDYDFE